MNDNVKNAIRDFENGWVVEKKPNENFLSQTMTGDNIPLTARQMGGTERMPGEEVQEETSLIDSVKGYIENAPDTVGAPLTSAFESMTGSISNWAKDKPLYRAVMMTDEEKLLDAQKISGIVGIDAKLLADNQFLYKDAKELADKTAKFAFLNGEPFSADTITKLYPEVDLSDPVNAALALKNAKEILQSRNIIDPPTTITEDIMKAANESWDTIQKSWEAGNKEFEAGELQYRAMSGELSTEEVEDKLKDIEKTEKEYNKAVSNSLIATMVGETVKMGTSMTRMTLKGAEEVIAPLGPSLTMAISQMRSFIPYAATGAAVAMGATGTVAAGAAAAAGALAGALALSKAAVYVGTYRAEAGGAYWDWMQKKDANGRNLYTREQALGHARRVGHMNAFIETASLDMALSGISKALGPSAALEVIRNKAAMESLIGAGRKAIAGKAAAYAGKQIVKTATPEILEEGLQQAVGDIDENIFGKSGHSTREIMNNAIDAMIQAVPASVGMALGGAALAGVGTYRGMRRISKLSKAELKDTVTEFKRENEKALIQKLMQFREGASLYKKSPEAYRKTLQKQLEDNAMGTIYIDVQTAAENENTHEALNKLVENGTITAKELDSAIKDGKPLELETGKYMQTATPEIHEALSDYTTMDKGEKTIHAIREERQRYKDMVDIVTMTKEKREAAAAQKILDERFSEDSEKGREDRATAAELFSGGIDKLQENYKAMLEEAKTLWGDLSGVGEYQKYMDSKEGGVEFTWTKDEEGFDTSKRISNNETWYRDFYEKHGRAPTQRELYDVAHENAISEYGDKTDEETVAGIREMEAVKKRVESLERIGETLKSLEKEDLIAQTLLDPETYEEAYKPLLKQITGVGNKEVTKAARDSALILAKIAENFHKNYGVPLKLATVQAGLAGGITPTAYQMREEGNAILSDEASQTIKAEIRLLKREDFIADTFASDYYREVSRASVEEVFANTINLVKEYMLADITDPVGDKIHFAPSENETLEQYVMHLIAGHEEKLDGTSRARALGVKLALQTIKNPMAIILQENGRKAYLSIYNDGENHLHQMVIGVQQDEKGRVITSFVKDAKRKDKNAPFSRFKNQIAASKKVLYIRGLNDRQGLSEHSRPQADQWVSKLSAKLHPLGNSIISQGKLGINESGESFHQMAGENAANAPLAKLEEAKRMEVEYWPEEIWKKTGWMRGPDGVWRFEIPDLLDQIDTDFMQVISETTLSHIYDNPKLYEAYPFLKDIPVRVENISDENKGTKGFADGESIILSRKWLKEDPEAAKLTLIHELQHIIQGKAEPEFSKGGNTESAKRAMRDTLDDLKVKLRDARSNEAVNAYVEAREAADKAGDDIEEWFRLGKKAEEIGDKLGLETKDGIDRLFYQIDELEKALKESNDYEAYRRLGGEAEAFMIMDRAKKKDNKSMPNYNTAYGSAVVNFGNVEYTLPFMASKEMNGEVQSLSDFSKRLEKDEADGWSPNASKWTDKNGITFKGERIKHAKEKHKLTDAQLDDIEMNIGNLFDAAISNRKGAGQFEGVHIIARIKGNLSSYRINLTFQANGSIQFETVFPGKEAAIKKEIANCAPRVLTSEKEAGAPPGKEFAISITSIQDRLGIVKKKQYFQSGSQYQGSYDRNTNVIELFDGANQSTVIHEGAHMFLSILENMSRLDMDTLTGYFDGNMQKAEEAKGKLLADLSAIRKWAAFSDEHLAEYKDTALEKEFLQHASDIKEGKAGAEERWIQERFARGFEKYLMDGSAPTKEMQGVFRRFRKWLTDIYKTAKNLGNVELTPEIKDIFDRMLATEDEINAWAAQRKLEAIDKVVDVNSSEMGNLKAWAEGVKDKALERAMSYYLHMVKEDAIENFRASIASEDQKIDFLKNLGEENEIYQIEAIYNSDTFPTEKEKKDFLAMSGHTEESLKEKLREAGGTSEERWEAHVEDMVTHYKEEALTPELIQQMAEDILNSPEGLQKKSRIEAMLLEKKVTQYINLVTSMQLELKRSKDKAKTARDIRKRLGLVSEKETTELDKQSETIAKSEDRISSLEKQVQSLKERLAKAKEGEAKAKEEKTEYKENASILEGNLHALERELIRERSAREKDKATQKDAEATIVDLSVQLETMVKGLRDSRKAMQFDLDLLKEDARNTLGGEKLSHATSWRWWQNGAQIEEGRAMAAAAKNDWAGVAYHKQGEAQCLIMAKEARRNEDEIRRTLHGGGGKVTTSLLNENGMERYGILGILNRISRTDKPVMMKNDARYFVQHMAYVLGIIKKDGILPIDEKGQERAFNWHWLAVEMNPMQAMDNPEYMAEDIIPSWMRQAFDGTESMKLRDLTMDQFREMAKVMKAVYRLGRREYEGNTLGTSFDKATEEITSEIYDSWNHRKVTPQVKAQTDTAIDRIKGKAHSLVKDITLPEILIERMGKSAYKYFYMPIDKATEHLRAMKQDARKIFRANFDTYSRKEWTSMRSKRLYAYGIDDRGEPMQWTKEQVIAMALNFGTKSNRQRLIETLWGNESDLLSFLDKTLTDKDWDFVEKVWAHLNSFWGERNKVQNDLYGTPLGKVPGEKFTLKSGRVIHGQYYRIKYDPATSSKAGRNQANDIARMDMENTSAFSLGMGSTKQRAATSGGQKLRLDLDVYVESVDEAMQHIAMREATVDVYKLLTRKEIVQAFELTTGPETIRMLQEWAKDNWHSSIKEMAEWDSLLGRARRRFNFTTMGFRLSTALLNIGNITGMMDRMGSMNALKACWDFYKNPQTIGEMYRFIQNKSTMMNDRRATIDRDMYLQDKIPVGKNESELRSVIEHGKYGVDSLNKNAYWFIQFTDGIFSYPEWLHTYRTALVELEAEGTLSREDMDKEAVRRADKMVRETFGSNETKDQTQFTRDNGVLAQMTSFFSYTNLVTNQFIRAGYILYDKGDIRPLLAATWYWWILGAAIETVIRASADDSDDEDKWEKKAIHVFASNGPFAGVPLLREIIPWTVDYFVGKKPFGSAAPDAPAFDMVKHTENFLKAMNKGDYIEAGRGATKAITRSSIPVPDTIVDAFWNLMRMVTTDTDYTVQQFIWKSLWDKSMKAKEAKR